MDTAWTATASDRCVCLFVGLTVCLTGLSVRLLQVSVGLTDLSVRVSPSGVCGSVCLSDCQSVHASLTGVSGSAPWPRLSHHLAAQSVAADPAVPS